MSWNFEDSERDDKIREIEYTIERIQDQIEANMGGEEGDDEISFSRLRVDEKRQVIVHFIKWGQVESYEDCSEILTIEDAKIAVREAAEFRDRLGQEDVADDDKDVEVCRPVGHGDLLVLPCSPCYYIAYAAVVDQDKGPGYTGFQQKDYSDTAETQHWEDESGNKFDDTYRQDLDPHLVHREFLLWNVSSQAPLEIDIGKFNYTEGTSTPSSLSTLSITELSPSTETVNIPSISVSQAAGGTTTFNSLTDIEEEDVDPCEDEPEEYDSNTTYAIGDIVFVMDNGVKKYFKVIHLNANDPIAPLPDGFMGAGFALWAAGQAYVAGDAVKVFLDAAEAAILGVASGNYIFECFAGHTSGPLFTDHAASWSIRDEEELHPWKPIEDWCLEQRIDDGTAKVLDIGTLEAENIGTSSTGPYTVGVYEPQPEGTPIEFDALTSIETLSFTAGSTSNPGNLDSIEVTTASTGNTGVVFKDPVYSSQHECTDTNNEYPCLDSGAAVEEDDEFYDPVTQKYYRAKADDSGDFPVSDSTKWEEITPATTPSNCLVLDVHDYTEQEVTVTTTRLPYAYGATTISGTAKARPITITPKDYRLESKELTFSKSQAYLNTSTAQAVFSNTVKNLTFKNRPVTITGTNTQILQQMKELKLESEQLRLESVEETGNSIEYTVSIFNKKLKSEPCAAFTVSIGTPNSFTMKGFEPDGSTQTVTKDLFSPTVSVTTGSSSTYTVGGASAGMGAEQSTLVELSLANVSIGAVTPDQQILLSNMDMTEATPCVDPDAWDSNELYGAGDYVMHGGNYYLALDVSQGNDPSDPNNSTLWEEKTQEEYCEDEDNQDALKPTISAAQFVVDPEETVSLAGTGPSTFQLTGTPQLQPNPDKFKSFEVAETARDNKAYIPMLTQCPVDNVTVEAFSGENPVSLAGSTRVSISASGSCDLVIQNQLKIKTKSYDVKCGVLANTDDVCPEETVVTNDMVVDAFTTQGYTEQALTQVWKTTVDVCDGTGTVKLHLLHVDPEEGTSGQTCAGWFIPCEYDDYGEVITPSVLKKDDTEGAELSLLSLDCETP